jgi:hypothetical protein
MATVAPPSIFYNPSAYNVDYNADDTMNIFGPIVTSTVNAYKDINQATQSLVLGATSNVLIEAMDGVNIYFDESKSLTVYNTDVTNNIRTDTSILTVTNSNNRAQVIATSIPLELYGSDANFTTKVSRTTFSTSNDYQVVGTSKDQFLFQNSLQTQDDLVANNNIACAGNLYSSTLNLYKNLNNGTSNVATAYGFYINEYDQLELVRFNKYQNNSQVTTEKKRVATFGKADSPYRVGELSNFMSLDQYTGVVDGQYSQMNGVTTSMTSILWTSQSGNPSSNIYYNLGNVGIGAATPTEKLHVVGNMKIQGHILPAADIIYDLGSSNLRFKDLYLSGDTIKMGNAYISVGTSGNFIFGTENNNNLIDMSQIENIAKSASNAVFSTPTSLSKTNNLNDLSNVTSARSNLGLGPSNTVGFSNINVHGDIMPSQNSMQKIGSSTNRFKEAWIDSLHISQNTLYLGDTPVLGTSDQTINIKADPGQSINISTKGAGGNTMLTSENEVQLSTSGLNTQVKIQTTGAGSAVVLGSSNDIRFNSPSITANGNLTVTGNLIVTGSNVVATVQTVTISDNIIVLNKGEVGNGVTAGRAGIQVDRGESQNAYQFVFDEAEDMFKVGQIGQLETLASHNWAHSNTMIQSKNLSDLPNKIFARSNLELGASNSVSFSNLSLVGNLGIGTSNPAYKLHVVGEIYSTGMVTSLSDSNFKTNVLEIQDSLAKLEQLHGYTFEFTTESNNRRYAGVLAQEVQKVLPEAIVETATGELSVTYGNLSALIINAVKDLKKEVDDLKLRL